MADLNIGTPITDVLNFGGKILDKLFPDKDELEKNKSALLQLAMSGELSEVQTVLSDVTSARGLAAQEIAGGNNLTRFLSATVRPVAGYLAICAVAYSVISHQDLTPMVKDVVNTIIEFYFGGRILEKVMPHLSDALTQIKVK